jgi:hypothetical protein
MMARETSLRTTHDALACLRYALEWAVSVELVPRNVAEGVTPPVRESVLHD